MLTLFVLRAIPWAYFGIPIVYVVKMAQVPSPRGFWGSERCPSLASRMGGGEVNSLRSALASGKEDLFHMIIFSWGCSSTWPGEEYDGNLFCVIVMIFKPHSEIPKIIRIYALYKMSWGSKYKMKPDRFQEKPEYSNPESYIVPTKLHVVL